MAIRVARLLAPRPDERVLDVGCGIGKVCAVGALCTQATWYGVEQHESLALVAESLSRELGVAARTRFIYGDAFALDWRDFDAFYFYNPFEPPLFGHVADSPPQPHDGQTQAERAKDRLASLRPQTRVVTYNGLGDTMPNTFELVRQERARRGLDLVLWIKRSNG